MFELLPILFGLLSGFTLRRLRLADARVLALTLALGLLCSFVAAELTRSWLYIFVDWMTVYASHAVVRLVSSRLLPTRRMKRRPLEH